MNISEAINHEVDKLPVDAERAFIQLDLEANDEKQSASVVMEYKKGRWSIVAGAGLEHVVDKLDWEAKGQIKYAW